MPLDELVINVTTKTYSTVWQNPHESNARSVILTGAGRGDLWVKEATDHFEVVKLVVYKDVFFNNDRVLDLPNLVVLDAPYLVLDIDILGLMPTLKHLNISKLCFYYKHPLREIEATPSNINDKPTFRVKNLTLGEYDDSDFKVEELFPEVKYLAVKMHCPLSTPEPSDRNVVFGHLPFLREFSLKIKCCGRKIPTKSTRRDPISCEVGGESHLTHFVLTAPRLRELILSRDVALDFNQVKTYLNLRSISLDNVNWDWQSDVVKTYMSNLDAYHPIISCLEYIGENVPLDFTKMTNISSLSLQTNSIFDCGQLACMTNLKCLALFSDAQTQFNNIYQLANLQITDLCLKPFTKADINCLPILPHVDLLRIILESDPDVDVVYYLEVLAVCINTADICKKLEIQISRELVQRLNRNLKDRYKYMSVIARFRQFVVDEILKKFDDYTF
jgi:hypothetical protein